MQCKTGAEHIDSLKDGRTIYIDGTLVDDVTVHPAYRNAVASAARLYDYQSRPENLDLMTFVSEGCERRVNRAWQMPHSYAELVQRRNALQAWAQVSYGFMGRSPDHVASTLIGQRMGIEVFNRYAPARAKALVDYVDYASQNDLFLTYVIVNPQADRSKDWGNQVEELVAQIVDEDSTGLTIRGAKMLGTSSIMANEVFVANLQPLKPGEEALAFSCALPMSTPGLRVLSRKSYEAHAASVYDNPLSARFDENDALLYFDNVKVPWDRVFVHRDTDMCRAQFHDTPAHIFQNYQAQIRLSVKMRFLVGLAHKITEAIGTTNMPQVREQLGALAANAGMVEAMLSGMEASGGMRGEFYLPNRHLVYAAQVITQDLYPRLITMIRDLAGGSLIMLPSSFRDWSNSELAPILHRTQRSPNFSPEDKVKLLKAAWDAIGSEFGSRHVQYEMFYAGARFVATGHSYRTFDWGAARGMVDHLLSAYDLEDITRSQQNQLIPRCQDSPIRAGIMSFTSGEFRKALSVFPTGVAVVTSRAPDGLFLGTTVSSFNSVSLEPPLVLFSLARTVLSFPKWRAASAWGISVLDEAQDSLSTRFAQARGPKWIGIEPVMGATGVPLIPGALAHFECGRYALHDGGDHVIFVGQVLALGRPPGLLARPLVFFAGRYQQVAQPRQGASEGDERLLHGW